MSGGVWTMTDKEFKRELAAAWAAGYAKGGDVAAWAIGGRPESERPDTSNPFLKPQP